MNTTGAIADISLAKQMARRGRESQKDIFGDPYIWHPMRVSLALSLAGAPRAVIIAGLLHDSIDGANVTLADIDAKFGSEVAGIVNAVTRYDEQWIEYMLRLVSWGPGAVMVKLADIIDTSDPRLIKRVGTSVADILRSQYERDMAFLSPFANHYHCSKVYRSLVARAINDALRPDTDG